MGLVVTGTERQGKLVQGGETEAKGQKGKVQVRRESLVWLDARFIIFLGTVWEDISLELFLICCQCLLGIVWSRQ